MNLSKAQISLHTSVFAGLSDAYTKELHDIHQPLISKAFTSIDDIFASDLLENGFDCCKIVDDDLLIEKALRRINVVYEHLKKDFFEEL
jgi:hypothetical protein